MSAARKSAIASATVLALVVMTASPSLAQKGRDYRGGEHMSAARAAAIHECNVRSDKYLQRDWGVTEIEIYRACMADHHQVE